MQRLCILSSIYSQNLQGSIPQEQRGPFTVSPSQLPSLCTPLPTPLSSRSMWPPHLDKASSQLSVLVLPGLSQHFRRLITSFIQKHFLPLASRTPPLPPSSLQGAISQSPLSPHVHICLFDFSTYIPNRLLKLFMSHTKSLIYHSQPLPFQTWWAHQGSRELPSIHSTTFPRLLWPQITFFSFLTFFLQLYWDINDIHHSLSLQCTMRWFDTGIYCEMITQ